MLFSLSWPKVGSLAENPAFTAELMKALALQGFLDFVLFRLRRVRGVGCIRICDAVKAV